MTITTIGQATRPAPRVRPILNFDAASVIRTLDSAEAKLWGNAHFALGAVRGLLSEDVQRAIDAFMVSARPDVAKQLADAAMSERIADLAQRRGIDLDNPPCETDDECPLEDCHHPHKVGEACTYVVEVDGEQLPCNCDRCDLCEGHQVVPGPNGHGEKVCPRCMGWGKR